MSIRKLDGVKSCSIQMRGFLIGNQKCLGILALMILFEFSNLGTN